MAVHVTCIVGKEMQNGKVCWCIVQLVNQRLCAIRWGCYW